MSGRARVTAGALLAVIVLVGLGLQMRRDTSPHEPVTREERPPATTTPPPPVVAARTRDPVPPQQEEKAPLALPERPTASYAGDRSGLSRSLLDERDAVNSCVFRHRRGAGRFTITMILEAQESSDGVVTAFTSTEGDEELERCIEAVLNRNAFDPPEGGAVELQMPWVGPG